MGRPCTGTRGERVASSDQRAGLFHSHPPFTFLDTYKTTATCFGAGRAFHLRGGLAPIRGTAPWSMAFLTSFSSFFPVSLSFGLSAAFGNGRRLGGHSDFEVRHARLFSLFLSLVTHCGLLFSFRTMGREARRSLQRAATETGLEFNGSDQGTCFFFSSCFAQKPIKREGRKGEGKWIAGLGNRHLSIYLLFLSMFFSFYRVRFSYCFSCTGTRQVAGGLGKEGIITHQ